MRRHSLRTWLEIDKKALHSNVEQFLSLIPKHTRLMAVVKSNAYGHGLWQVASQLANSKFKTLNSKRLWLGVDSIVEGLRLRREGIKNPILVLGATLPSRLAEAAAKNITLTVSTFELFKTLAKSKKRPAFHVKIDTGMHRHGFLPTQTLQLLNFLNDCKLSPQGVFTHFATANDFSHAAYMRKQFRVFQEAVDEFQKAGFRNLVCHAASSGGTLYYPNTHLDMVRVGMSIYGYTPSKSKIKNQKSKIDLRPVLTWKTVVAEVKEIPKGSYVGYDITERVKRKTKIVILPIGYWHGFDRGLSKIGEVLVHGRRAKVLGRVSMDIIVVDATHIPSVRVGDEVVLIGRQKKEHIWADEVGKKIGTTQYEILTRINPLIRRVLV